jgi:uncharacterized protein with HEPN domain
MTDDRGYLSDIRDCIDRIEDYTRDGRDAFMASTLIQDGVVRNFEVIGEAAKRLTPALTQTRPEIPWRRVAGFRDVLIHQYQSIDLYIIWNVVEHELPDLKRAVAVLLAQLDAQP